MQKRVFESLSEANDIIDTLNRLECVGNAAVRYSTILHQWSVTLFDADNSDDSVFGMSKAALSDALESALLERDRMAMERDPNYRPVPPEDVTVISEDADSIIFRVKKVAV